MIARTKIQDKRGGAKIGDIIKTKDSNGYIVFGFKGKLSKAHRFIFYCYHGILYEFIDHKDTIKDNNWISNLRGATKLQNQQNRKTAQSSNTTGFLGVSFSKVRGKYVAMIRINGINTNLGAFYTPEEAHQAYVTAKRIHHEFCTI